MASRGLILLIALLLCLHSSNGFRGSRTSYSWKYSRWTTLFADENIDDFGDFASAPTIVFVGNLPFTYDESSLLQLAKTNGITSPFTARIEKNKKTGKSRGFGYLDFDTNAAAQKSLTQLTGVEVDGRILKLDFDGGTDTPTRGRRQSATSDAYSMFLGNIPFSMSADDVQHLVRTTVGDMAMKVRLSEVEGRSRGFGHVDFGNLEDVEKAILTLEGFEIFDRALKAERALGKRTKELVEERDRPMERQNSGIISNSIFMGNLAFDCTVEDVVSAMDEVLGPGTVKAVRLSIDRETGTMKGFGHADFDTPDQAAWAVEKLQGVEVRKRDRILFTP